MACNGSCTLGRQQQLLRRDLYEKSEHHWNQTVLGLAQNVLKMYHDQDMVTYQECQSNFLSNKEALQQAEAERKRKWEELEAKAKAMRLVEL